MSKAFIAVVIVMLLISLRKFYRRHFRRGLVYLSLATLSFLVGIVMYRVQLNLESYSVIHNERDIAEVDFSNMSSDQAVYIKDLVTRRNYRWAPKGVDWRIDLRILRLKGVCRILNWPDYYRLASLKASEVVSDESDTVHVVQLQQDDMGWDVWKKLRKFKQKRPDLVDQIEACIVTDILSSDALPQENGKRFRFSFSGAELRHRQLSE